MTMQSADSKARSAAAHIQRGSEATSVQPEAAEAFFMPPVQAKLSINQPGDPYEQEADRVADQVVQRLENPAAPALDTVQRMPITPLQRSAMPSNTPIQAKCTSCEQEEKLQKKEEEEQPIQEKIQRKPIFESGAEPPDEGGTVQRKAGIEWGSVQMKCASCESEEKVQEKEEEEEQPIQEKIQRKPIFDSGAEPPDDEGRLQRKTEPLLGNIQMKCAACEQEDKVQREGSGTAPSVPANFSSRLQSSKGGGSPLSAEVSSSMGEAMGTDFSNVRVHTGSEAVGMSNSIQAQAFTHGSDVYFNEGKYDPGSKDGKRLLAHELVHVGQQGGEKETINLYRVPRLMSESNHTQESPTVEMGSTAEQTDSFSHSDDALRVSEHTNETELGRENQSVSISPIQENLLRGTNPSEESINATAQTGTSAEQSPDILTPEDEVSLEQERPNDRSATGNLETSPSNEGSESSPDGDGTRQGSESTTPESLEYLATGNIALIDEELAEHQRWGAASAQVGETGSTQRAQFIAEAAGAGALTGAAHGLGMGLAVGAGSRLVELGVGQLGARLAASAAQRLGTQAARFTPLPAVGAVIGGLFSAYNLARRDWGHTGETISRFGEGASIYEQLANSIAAVSEVIDVATNVLNVIAGVIGGISIAMWVISVLTVGVASPLAATLSTIAGAIGIGTMILDGINALVLQQLITLFRSLHAFTSQADPREVVAQGASISQAAGAAAGFVGGVAGGVAGAGLAGRAAARLPRRQTPTTPILDHPNPTSAQGEGPTVRAEPGEQLSLPFEEPVQPKRPRRPRIQDPELSRLRDRVEQRSGERLSPEEIRQLDIASTYEETLRETRQMSERGGLVESEMHDVPGERQGTYLRRGERMPGAPEVPPHIRNELRHRARAAATAELRAALADPSLHNSRTMKTLSYLSADEVVRFQETGALPEGYEFHHYEGLAENPQVGHLPESGALLPYEVHIGEGHAGDVTHPLETASPRDPQFEDTWGWQEDRSAQRRSRTRQREVAEGTASTGDILMDIEIEQRHDQRALEGLRAQLERVRQQGRSTRSLEVKISRRERIIAAREQVLSNSRRTNREATTPVGEQTTLSSATPGEQLSFPFDEPTLGTQNAQTENSSRTQLLNNPLLQGARLGATGTGTMDRDARTSIIERVNPAYPPPPATPQQIIGIQNEIQEILQARAQAEEIESSMHHEQQLHEANQEPVTRAQTQTQEAITATQAHQEATARRQAANQEQQQQEEQTSSTIQDYANRQAGLSAITGPLLAFERFTYLANFLPDSPNVLLGAKRSILHMHGDAQNFLNALNGIDQSMDYQREEQPQRAQQIQENETQLDQANQAATDSHQTFDNALDSAQTLEQENQSRIEQATQTRSEAAQTSNQLEEQAQTRQTQVQSLSQALENWAQAHRNARLSALQATGQRLEQQGYTNIQESER